MPELRLNAHAENRGQTSTVKTKALATILSTLFLASLGAAVDPVNPSQQQEKGDFEGFSGIKQSQGFDLPLFSALDTGQSTYNPGDYADLELEAEMNQDLAFEDAEWVVAIYNCGDTTCESPPEDDINGDGVLDSCQIEGDVREGKDDCVALTKESLGEGGFGLYTEGYEPSTEISYQIPDGAEAGRYAAEGYMWDTADSEFASDHPGTEFTVEEESSSPSPGGGDDDTDYSNPDPGTGDNDGSSDVASPDIRVQGGADVSVVDGNVRSEFTFRNYGGTQPDNWIVEMQVRPQGAGVLSFTSPSEKTCESERPENVHKEYRISEGDSQTITLTSNGLPETQGNEYSVYLLTRNECFGEDGNTPVEPFTGVRHVADVQVEEPDSIISEPGGNALLPLSAGLVGLGLLTAIYVVVIRG